MADKYLQVYKAVYLKGSSPTDLLAHLLDNNLTNNSLDSVLYACQLCTSSMLVMYSNEYRNYLTLSSAVEQGWGDVSYNRFVVMMTQA